MKSPYFILLCHLFLLFSCNRSQNTKNNFLKNFIPSHDIEITVLDSTDLVVDFIPSMVKMKDKIIYSQFTGDTIFSSIDLIHYKKNNFGKRGRGNNEFTEGYGLEKINDSILFIFDRTLAKLMFLQLSNDTIIFLPSYPTNHFMLDVHYGNDSIYFVTGTGNLEKNYALYNRNSKMLRPFISYPKGVNDNLTLNGKSRIYYSHIVRHPGMKKYMAFKDKHHIIDILEIKNDSLILVKRNIFTHFKWKMVSGVYRPSEKGTPNRVFTSKLVGLSKYVCALYKQDHSEFILTFDWDGTPLNSYKLPCHLLNFTGDDSLNFYGIALIGENYNLIHFKL